MISDLLRHKADYAALIFGALIFVVYFLAQQLYPLRLLAATIMFGGYYVLWGILHHFRSRSLHPKVVLEYFLISLIAVLLVSTLLI